MQTNSGRKRRQQLMSNMTDGTDKMFSEPQRKIKYTLLGDGEILAGSRRTVRMYVGSRRHGKIILGE